jgi:hypothetical protein
VRVLFDTNILIDHSIGIAAAKDVLRLYDDSAISIVTRIEFLAGAQPGMERLALRLLERFHLVQLDEQIADEAARVRRDMRLKFADAIVLASARVTGRTLLTRDAKDFHGDALAQVPYRL